MKTAPILIVFAGPNGAGKSTLRNLLFSDSRIPFVNADIIAAEQQIGAYEAAEQAELIRRELFDARRSFMFETVLSDPVGAKVDFLLEARRAGYRVLVHFVGLPSAAHSAARVFQRVNEGGHDVPDDKLEERYPRVLANLARLTGKVDVLTIYDNSSQEQPYREIARMEGENLTSLSAEIPAWLAFLDLSTRATSATRPLP